MTTETLKSASITNSDATPALANTAGEGGKGAVHSQNDYITPTSGKTAGSIYRMCRIRSDAKVKHVRVEGGAQTQGAYDIGLYYSDAADGTSAANVAAAATAIDADFFGSAVDFASAVGITDVTNESGTYTAAKRNQPIWQAAGLSADPGGYFDVCFTNTNTITTGALMGMEVETVR